MTEAERAAVRKMCGISPHVPVSDDRLMAEITAWVKWEPKGTDKWSFAQDITNEEDKILGNLLREIRQWT